jgi:predicted double-glycine peptidase
MMRADEEEGTSIFEMIKVPIKQGLNAEHHFNMTMNDLELFVNRGTPVIVLIQAWRGEEDMDKEWADLWDDGHYVVVIGVDEKYVYFEEPSILGGIGYIPKAEFMDRWHDYDTDASAKYIHYGMTVYGKRESI